MRNHNPVKRYYILPKTPKRAIAAKCAGCMGCTKDYLEEGFKNEIRNCSAQACPLHAQALLRLKLGEAVNNETYSGARA